MGHKNSDNFLLFYDYLSVFFPWSLEKHVAKVTEEYEYGIGEDKINVAD